MWELQHLASPFLSLTQSAGPKPWAPLSPLLPHTFPTSPHPSSPEADLKQRPHNAGCVLADVHHVSGQTEAVDAGAGDVCLKGWGEGGGGGGAGGKKGLKWGQGEGERKGDGVVRSMGVRRRETDAVHAGARDVRLQGEGQPLQKAPLLLLGRPPLPHTTTNETVRLSLHFP